ncbi:hypothetical protein AB0F30_16680 [Streptomyces sp. NPDC029006]|uniref:deazapurine DNA modification protein DpdA family protein n=1 Tax=Streptomyces sp. NPDC029006 TaxID=3155467 RepID=UPI0033C4DF90
MTPEDFYVGVKPHLMAHTSVPVMVSDVNLRDRRKLPAANGPVTVDSEGFSQLQKYGRWTRTFRQYAGDVRRYQDWFGPLFRGAFQQDYMCEDAIIHGGTFGKQRFVGTGLTLREHLHRTVGNYLDLMGIDDTLEIFPVVQGRRIQHYEYCIDLFDKAGVNLRELPVVGIGSVCRIQGTPEAVGIVRHVASIVGTGRLHAFGFKTEGLREVGDVVGRADSFAWGVDGMHKPGCDFRLPTKRGHRPHKHEANCLRFMLEWRQGVLDAIGKPNPRPLRTGANSRKAGGGQMTFDDLNDFVPAA